MSPNMDTSAGQTDKKIKMTDFNTRKAARIAEGNSSKKFRFLVISNHYAFPAETVAVFASKKVAEEFATKQVGSFAGRTEASILFASRHRNEFVPTGVQFKVERQEVIL